MSAESIKIVCNTCGSVLSVKSQPGIENKNITCPVCKTKAPFKSYRPKNATPPINDFPGPHPIYDPPVPKNSVAPSTMYGPPIPNNFGAETILGPTPGSKVQSGGTVINNDMNTTIGRLFFPAFNRYFDLNVGANVVGRQANGSSASIQIPCPSNRVSREHLSVDVLLIPQKGYVHYASLAKKNVNATFVNNVELKYGDVLVLKDGDIIKLVDIAIRFELANSDTDCTQFI